MAVKRKKGKKNHFFSRLTKSSNRKSIEIDRNKITINDVHIYKEFYGLRRFALLC